MSDCPFQPKEITVSESAETQEIWDTMYREKERVWTGRANVRLVEVVSELAPGRVLDLGCGEGGDSKWLAANGWQVTAVDISEEALRRAAQDAGELASRIDFQHHDLTQTFPDGQFDLVSAQFLHSPVDWDRYTLLRRAAAAVAPGGILLIVDHGGAPPWASRLKHHHPELPSVHEVFEGMALDTAMWEPLRVDTADREATGPEGQVAIVPDNVIVLRRKP
jgi:SAM-dependent methyltransferase